KSSFPSRLSDTAFEKSIRLERYGLPPTSYSYRKRRRYAGPPLPPLVTSSSNTLHGRSSQRPAVIDDRDGGVARCRQGATNAGRRSASAFSSGWGADSHARIPSGRSEAFFDPGGQIQSLGEGRWRASVVLNL